MNYIVGQLLMHCSETLSFWLFVELIEECELRDIYQKGLPGVAKHKYIIRYLLKKHLPDLYEHLELLQVNFHFLTYAGEWIFSIFCQCLPYQDSAVSSKFFSLFFKYKWEFFYKLILTIFDHIKEKLMMMADDLSIL